MLILTRKIGESIFINDNEIKIHILGVDRNQIRVGIEAPIDMSINREEIYISKKLARENLGNEIEVKTPWQSPTNV